MRKLGVILVITTVVAVLWNYGRELIAADRCLDGSRVYDYQENRCRSDVVHLPFTPYAERRSDRLVAAGALAALGLGLILFGRRDP